MALSDIEALVDGLVRDTGGDISTDQRDQAIDLARIRYSSDRPRSVVEAVTAAGGRFLELPDGWEENLSRLEKLAVPSGDDDREIEGEVALGIDGTRIKLASSVNAEAVVHAYFTKSHVLNGEEDTIPMKDREAVAGWAAQILLEQLASLFSGDRQPTIAADSVDHQAKGRDYAARARRLRESYLEQLGVDPKRTVAAAVIVDTDMMDSRGRDRLVHTQRRR